jgi:hypothetical protein
MRTFLDALDRSIVDCRELRGANWTGRSPLLGSIVRCRPKSVVEFDMLHTFSRCREVRAHLGLEPALHDRSFRHHHRAPKV